MKAAMTNTVEVMSFNIYHDASSEDKALPGWSGRKDLVIRTIDLHDPDVVGLQEALITQVEELVEALPRYDYVGVGRDDGHRQGESAAILHRKARFELDESGHFWFSETPNRASKGENSWGNFYQHRMTTWVRLLEKSTGQGFYVYNLHLNHDGGAEDPDLARWRSVLLLTERIRQLTTHMASNHKDFHTQRGLLKLVGQRRRLLAYLSREDVGRYNTLIKKLGLRK